VTHTNGHLRVWHVIDGLGTGGAERSLAELLPALAVLGINSTVWPLERRGRGVEAQLAENADVRFLAGVPAPEKVRRLHLAIRSEKPHIVHTTLFKATTVGRLAAARRVPVLTSLVNTPYDPVRRSDRNFAGGKLAMVQTFDRAMSRLSSHFHAITNAVAAAAARDLRIPVDRITVIARGRDATRLGTRSTDRARATRRALAIPVSAPVVVNVARQEFQKGQRHLLEAAKVLRADYPDLVVLICGREGAVTDELRALHEELALGESVRMLGHREDVPDIIAAADIFAFPSMFEGLGGSLIEAMALGTPIVASDIPPIRETVTAGECARLVPPGSSRELGAAISALLADPCERTRLGFNGVVRFREHYDLDNIAARMASLYRDVAEES
jgi:glycosyltransferase involved in cell wall biosynthesis